MPANTSLSQPQRRRQMRRLRVACTRCRQRKIRCDAATPSCAACMQSGARCVYDDDLPSIRRPRTQGSSIYLADQGDHAGQADIYPNQECVQVAGRSNAHSSQSIFSPAAPSDEGEAASGGGVDGSSYAPHPAASATRVPPLTSCSRDTNHDQPPSPPNENLSHQVGLVSLSAGVDPKYIGPSSGYFLTQLLSSATKDRNSRLADQQHQTQVSRRQQDQDIAVQAFNDTLIGLPSTESVAQQLSRCYFDSIHLQYPLLHRPSHERLIQQVYQSPTQDPISTFQVTMVLSISALVLSRRSHVELPAAGWCAAAVKNFSSLQVENSLRGLQCLLLLIVYAMHSPSSNFNAWSMNYQCIAMVLDLGLQREPSRASALTCLQRQMRTRIFWVVYSLDRKLSTMMGRPIGLRDEACDLRLPASVSDESLDPGHSPSSFPEHPCHIDFAIHLFKIAKINSEMKYVLHSVNRSTPSYAYPAIRDILQWQEDIRTQLDSWHANIPEHSQDESSYGSLLCRTQYHTVKTLLFLPTPGIPQPSTEALRLCYESSMKAIKLFRELYARDLLVYSWSTCHAIILLAFCLIYCTTSDPQVRAESNTETLLVSIREASDVLSATGEYWTGAKRTRDLLNDLVCKTLLNPRAERTMIVNPSSPPNQSAQGIPNANNSMPRNDDSITHNYSNNAATAFTPTSASQQALPRNEGDLGQGVFDDRSFQSGPQDFNQLLPFLFEGSGGPLGEEPHNYHFDISDLFTDAVNLSSNFGEWGEIRFGF